MKQDNSIMKRYEAVLKAVKTITKADDCSIFLLDSELGMDVEEKKEVFDERIEDIRQENKNNEDAGYYEFLKNLRREETEKYSILTFFIGTEDHWRLQSYKTRPYKYIVFNWKDSSPILKEGITAFTARTGEPSVINTRNHVEQHKAFSGKNEGPNLVHDNCCQVAIIAIKDVSGKIIGVIRCDIYALVRKPEFTQQTITQLEGVNNILCQIIHLGKEFEAAFSYDKIFHGINLLENLKEIQQFITDNTDGNIYKDTKKLFYVLKRRRYFGDEAIIERVKGYIKDVCDTLELDKNPILNLLESFRKHEDLMLYSNVNYRDHFMHQFHVFVVGYIILHYVGIEKVTKILNDKVIKLRGDELTIKNILRIWLLTSVFHDCSYLLPEFDKNIGTFLTEILEDPSNREKPDDTKFKFSVDLKWDQLTKAGFLQDLSKITEYLQVKHQSRNFTEISAELSRLMFEKRDHGVLGALIMLQKMSQADIWKGNIFYDIEKNIAALAIALHTSDAYQKARGFLGVRPYLFFENYPIVFLLAYCDFIQEWGRKSTNKTKELGSPMFHSLSYDQTNQNITCKLVYTPDSFSPSQTVPTCDQLEKWAQGIRNTFSSLNFGFFISYYHTAIVHPQKDDLKRTICDPINLKCFDRRKGLRTQCDQFYSLLDGGVDAYFTDFSCDSITGKCDIGFGTNSLVNIETQLDIKFNYGGTDLSGKYRITRAFDAAKGLPYKRFLGAEKIG